MTVIKVLVLYDIDNKKERYLEMINKVNSSLK